MKLKRILTLLLALLMLLSMAAACAEGYLTYVVDNTMKVYKYPNLLSRVMGTMSYGEDVRVLSWKDGWLKVQNDRGQIGYCPFGGLSTANPNNLNSDAYVKEAGAYVFAKPGTNFKSIGTVTMGQRLDALAMTPDEEWVRVSNGRRIGYIQADKLSKTPTSVHGSLNRVWIISDNATHIRSSSSMSSGSVGVVSHGQDYELIGKKDGQVCLRNGKGKIGWISEENVTTKNPNTLNETMYTQISGRVLFKNATFSTKYAGPSVKKNQAVTVVSKTPRGDFYRVKYNGKYYYASPLLFDREKVSSDGLVLKWKHENESLYRDGKTVYQPKKGEELLVLGTSTNGELLKVKAKDGTIGYRSYGFFTK